MSKTQLKNLLMFAWKQETFVLTFLKKITKNNQIRMYETFDIIIPPNVYSCKLQTIQLYNDMTLAGLVTARQTRISY